MENTKKLIEIFKPSQLEILLGVSIGLIAVGGLIYTIFFSSPEVSLYFDYQAENPSGAYATYQQANESVNSSEFAADASVFTFWSSIGLLSYAIVLGIGKMIQNFKQFESDITNRYIDKRAVLRDALLRILVRLIGVVGLYYSLITITSALVPFLLISVQRAKDELLHVALYIMLAFIVTNLAVYILAIFMRFITLRTRVFKVY